ncbi:hypothetical protein [Maribellus mangrovi]|uniref:hypothetical protein n=1 Tax=Maribellus mangrovi TaxID=3133146 RepID=UPI0030EB4AE1
MNIFLCNRILHYIKFQRWLKIKFFLLGLVIGLTVCAKDKNNTSKSDTLDYSWERFSFDFGGYLTGLNSDIQLESQKVGLGVNVNFEDALGLKNTSTVLRSEIHYNYGKRRQHTVDLEYFGLFRSAHKVLKSDIEIGDQVFPVGTELNSRFNLQIYKAKYSYAYFQDKRVKLDASFGLYVMPITFSAKALNLNGTATKFVAPLPIVGIGSTFAITPKLYLEQNIDFLYLKISNFKGLITDINFRIEYNAWKHFGFATGINSFHLYVNAYDSKHKFLDFKGTLKTSHTGLLFYAKYYF